MKQKYIYIIIIIFNFVSIHQAQLSSFPIEKIDTLKINIQNLYSISATNIVPFSEEIILRKKRLTTTEYKFDLLSLSFSLSDTLQYSIFDTIYVRYKSYYLGLRKEYKHRDLVKVYDTELGEEISKVKNKEIDLSTQSIFGKNLESSGTLLRGFTFGTNKDLSVNSGLNLQLSGQLSEDIQIIAALTDENTPIQPEGNTERLDELDKVFIEIKHKIATATFGDYDLKTRVGNFGNIDRKLQGVISNFDLKDYGGGFSVASSKGKFNSIQLNGIDGVQGPYRLFGADNENDIIVIAGSEKVYIDGKEMKRGDNNDYIIEYSNAEITFTPKVIMTSLSRITVDFEYTNRRYERNLLSANAFVNLYDNKLKIYINALQEGDNKNAPIDFSLSDEDRNILKTSGNNIFAASKSGVILASNDSNGSFLGVYIKLDTLINNIPTEIFVYKPGDDSAKYNVNFSFVGENKGDYIRESKGKFKYVGANKGSYLPIRLIPIPQNNQLGNLVVEYKPVDKIKLNLEFAGSNWDRNTFSEIDDKNNSGYARNLQLTIEPLSMKMFNTNLGSISGKFRERYLDDKFKPIDRINEIEFERGYNIANVNLSGETLREFRLLYSPHNLINISSDYGFLKKGVQFNSNRYQTNVNINGLHNINLNYNYDFVNSNNSKIKSDWLRQTGEISYLFWKIKTGIGYRSENKEDKSEGTDSLNQNSLGYIEFSPFIDFNFSSGLNLLAKYSSTKEKFPVSGKLINESKTSIYSTILSFREIKEFTTTLDFSFREKIYDSFFKQKGFGNNESILIRSQSQINLLERLITGNIYYQTSSERSARFEKVFLRVPQNTGNYSYIGDLNSNGIADENEFVQDFFEGDFIQTTIPTDELFPVIDLKLNTRWRIDFVNYAKGNDLFQTILKNINTETTFRVEENSKEKDSKKIYLLNFNNFLNDSTTIRGSNFFEQDIHLFKNQRDLSFRFRFTERKNKNQFSSGLEKGYLKERSVRINFRMIKEINNETKFIIRNENVFAPVSTNRSRDVVINELESDFSYRPESNLEFGFKFLVGKIEDSFPSTPTIIDKNGITLRFTLSLLNKGRLRIEAERTELISNSTGNIIPFEITNGNLIGKNYIWRASFDYKFSNNLQSNINYSGRKQGKGKIISLLSAEARAYF